MKRRPIVKPYPVHPKAALHVARRIQRERPQVEFRNPWGALAFCVLFLVFIGSLAAVVLHYLAK